MRFLKQKLKKIVYFTLFVLGLTLSTHYFLNYSLDKEIKPVEHADLDTRVNLSASILQSHPDDLFLPSQDHVFIPRLNVQAPILTPEKNNRSLIGELMNQGAVHDLMSAPFGYTGNSVLFGHSSSDVDSEYADIFAPLIEIEHGDEVQIFSNDKQYIYQVIETLIVEPTDHWITQHQDENSILTIYTCFPPGSDKNRLTVRAELVKSSERSN